MDDSKRPKDFEASRPGQGLEARNPPDAADRSRTGSPAHEPSGHTGVDAGWRRRLCIPCALSRHDFRERANIAPGDPWRTMKESAAWIDGRLYHLLWRDSTRELRCFDCGRAVSVAYEPD